MSVMIDLNYVTWDGTYDDDGNKNLAPGWPQLDGKWGYEQMGDLAPALKAAGFASALYPPSTHGASGRVSQGYDVYDYYSLDGTAWGDEVDLIASLAAFKAVGMQVGADIVVHQNSGGPGQVYDTAQFPRNPTCFAKVPGQTEYPGNVDPDPVPDSSGNYAFGDLCAFAQPDRFMWDNMIAAAQWLMSNFNFARFDDVKGTNGPFIRALRAALSENYVFGEYYVSNLQELYWWVHTVMEGNVAVLDFATKFTLQAMCNNNSNYWMGSLSNMGYNLWDAANALTFLESRDTYYTDGTQVIWNKIAGYAVLLTTPGYPCVYWEDWAGPMQAALVNLIWIHNNLAQGEFVIRLEDNFQVFAYERLGYGDAPGCVVVINNNQYAVETVTIQTNFGANQRCHEYTGNGGYLNDRWTNEQGQLTVTVPRNDNGYGYLVYGKSA